MDLKYLFHQGFEMLLSVVSAMPSFGDKVICWYSGFAFQTIPLIQEGHLSVIGEKKVHLVLVNYLGGLPRNSVVRITGFTQHD